MSNSTKPDSLQWMIDVGVCGIEVRWLERMIGSPKLTHPVAARRVEEIQKQAYEKLVACA